MVRSASSTLLCMHRFLDFLGYLTSPALIQSLGSPSFPPTPEIPANEACFATAVRVSSTPSFPARRDNFDVNAMFQGGTYADVLDGYAPLVDEEETESPSAAAETMTHPSTHFSSPSLASYSRRRCSRRAWSTNTFKLCSLIASRPRNQGSVLTVWRCS